MAVQIKKNECSICLNYYTNPKIIDCLHTFCATCLDNYVKTTATNNQFSCPMCRRAIKLPAGGVSKFPVNFYIDEQQLPEVGSQCQQHKPEEDEQESVSVCPQHKKENDLFCKNCNLTLCYKCFVTGHQGHTIQNVEDVEREINKQLEELKNINRERIAKNKKVIDDINAQIYRLEIQFKTESDKVDTQIMKIHQVLIDFGKGIKKGMREKFTKQKLELIPKADEVKSFIDKIETFKKKSSSMKVNSSLGEMLQDIQNIRQEMQQKDRDFTVPTAASSIFQEGDIKQFDLGGLIGQCRYPIQQKNSHQYPYIQPPHIRLDQYRSRSLDTRSTESKSTLVYTIGQQKECCTQ